MAKALECPACGAKHRLDGLQPSATFRCERCGQTLKVPATVPAAAPAAELGASTIAPPPRRRAPGSPEPREVIAVSATLAAVDGDGPASKSNSNANSNSPSTASSASTKSKRAANAAGPRRRVHWYWRLVAWLVAVPLGFLITAWPAYEFGLIKKGDVLDIFVGSGTGRYTRLAVGTLIWALITALLVQLFVEGGRRWADRRRQRRDTAVLSGARAAG